MKRLMWVAAGGAVGYVLGAKAGRPAYDRLVQRWDRMSSSMRSTDMVEEVGRSASDLTQAATRRATREATDAMDRATEAIATDETSAGGPATGQAEHRP